MIFFSTMTNIGVALDSCKTILLRLWESRDYRNSNRALTSLVRVLYSLINFEIWIIFTFKITAFAEYRWFATVANFLDAYAIHMRDLISIFIGSGLRIKFD